MVVPIDMPRANIQVPDPDMEHLSHVNIFCTSVTCMTNSVSTGQYLRNAGVVGGAVSSSCTAWQAVVLCADLDPV